MHDKFDSGTTVGITAFCRPKKLRKVLRSVVGHRRDFDRVVVADNGKTDLNLEVYKDFEDKLNLQVLDLEFDSGVSYSRNQIVENTETEYLLLLDDDITVPEKLGCLESVLDKKPNVKAVSGSISENGETYCPAHNITVKNGVLKRHATSFEKGRIGDLGQGRFKYYLFDFIPCPGLYRTECLREQGWDEKLKIGKEHLDFFMRLKKLGGSFSVVPEVKFEHYPGGSKYYKNKRNQREFDAEEYLKKKHGLDSIAWISSFIEPDENKVSRSVKTFSKKLLPARLVGRFQRKQILA